MKRMVLILMAVLLALAVGAALAEEPAGAVAEEYAEVPAEPVDVLAEVPAIDPAEEPAGAVAEEYAEVPAEPVDVLAEVPAIGPAEEPANSSVAESANSAAEEPAAEVISGDAACPHLHTKTVNYFDAPDYRPMDDEVHLVVGSAMVEVSCLDCGAILSVSSETNVEEVNPHLFRNGYCVFCGREAAVAPQPEPAAPVDEPAPAPREMEVYLSSGENPNHFFASFTDQDLKSAGDMLVLRPEGMDAALAMQTERLREEMERSGGALEAIVSKPGERDISTTLRLYDASGMEFTPAGVGISLRIYTENRPAPLTVSFTNSSGATSTEEARWADGGYWVVTWLGDGLYQYQ